MEAILFQHHHSQFDLRATAIFAVSQQPADDVPSLMKIATSLFSNAHSLCSYARQRHHFV